MSKKKKPQAAAQKPQPRVITPENVIFENQAELTAAFIHWSVNVDDETRLYLLDTLHKDLSKEKIEANFRSILTWAGCIVATPDLVAELPDDATPVGAGIGGYL